MDRLALQIGKEAVSALLRGDKKSGGARVQAGPRTRMPSPLPISDRDAWSDLLPPLREFLQANDVSTPDVRIVPLDVDLEVLSFPKVKRMRPDTIVESHYHIQKATEAMARETVWCTIPSAPIAGKDLWSFATLSLTRHLARRLREIAAALGCPESRVHVVPYPVAAGSCLARHVGGAAGAAAALLEIGAEESSLVICWRGIPVRYVRLPLGTNSLLNVLRMKIALEPGVTRALSEAEAEELLGQVDLAPNRPNLEGEETPHSTEVLHSLFIALERYRQDVTSILEEESDAWPLRGAPVLMHSQQPLTGIAEFFAETAPTYQWERLTPSPTCSTARGDGTAGGCLTPAVCGLCAQPEPQGAWHELDREQEKEGGWFSLSQFVAPPLLGIALGVLAGLKGATHLAGMASPQASVEEPGNGAVRRPSLQELKAAQAEALSRRRLLVIGEVEDRIAREFLAELCRLSYERLCLDQVSLVAHPRGESADEGTAEVVVSGRAGAPDRGLQQLLDYFSSLQSVESALLENVEENPERGLSCRFQVLVRLKVEP